MAVLPGVSAVHFQAEVARARPLALADGWELEVLGDLKLRATILVPGASAGAPRQYPEENYVYEFSFDNYREWPPLIDLVHPTSGERNLPKCFPSGGKGYYHGGPNRICAYWSRSAYGPLNGPHPEWSYANWVAMSEGIDELGLMLALIRNLFRDPSYQGRAGR